MQDVVLAIAFLAMILSPCALHLLRVERGGSREAANNEVPTAR